MTSIYIHWPFCESKCPYCDFNSHVRSSYPQLDFASKISDELAFISDLVGQKQISSVFFGGGTPSLMEATTVQKIINAINKYFILDQYAEISLEANPSSFEVLKFADFKKAGINRVSLGIQAIDDKRLKYLGRRHDAATALQAMDSVSKIFDNFNFDFIYACQGQSLKDWEDELKQVLCYEAPHLSLYQLTIEPQTVFAKAYERGQLVMPTDEMAAQFYELTGCLTKANGYNGYEVSNYSKPNCECRHNLNYWRYGEYFGIGPGAHGRMLYPNYIANNKESSDKSTPIIATTQFKMPEKWFKQNVATSEAFLNIIDDTSAENIENVGRYDQLAILTPLQMLEEKLIMNLRLNEGLDLASWTNIKDQPILKQLSDNGLVTWENSLNDNGSKITKMFVTNSGRLVLQSITSYLAQLLEV